MFLEYGVNDIGSLVHIDQVRRGKTDLHCPYCKGLLTAKKGQQVSHHFAHVGETCRQVDRDPDTINLPVYDRFNLNLSGRAVQELHSYVLGGDGFDEEYLAKYGVVEWNDFKGRSGGYVITKKGKLVVGELSLMLFNDFQEPLILERHDHLDRRVFESYEKPKIDARRAELKDEIDRIEAAIKEEAAQVMREKQSATMRALSHDEKWPIEWEIKRRYAPQLTPLRKEYDSLPYYEAIEYETALIDLRLFRAQWQRILTTTLYFLEVQHAAGTLHKIGVTTRDINLRLPEIEHDLTPLVGPVRIKVLDTWDHRGNVELYFKHRYKRFNHPLGNLTEYYKFDDVTSVIRDLRRMKPKELSELERGVIAGDLSPFEDRIRLDEIESKRRRMIRAGMRRASERGKPIGRPKGSHQDVEDFLAKPEIVRVRTALDEGLSLRAAARSAGVAVNTVRKVQAILDQRKQTGLHDQQP